ncbi:MAG: SRPBCC family protein [Nitrospinota bacterium]|nr:SRPBCC family protein [Nitrospinota bacterium]
MRNTRERIVGGKTEGLLEHGEDVTWRARHWGLWWNLTSRITEFNFPVYFCDEMVKGPFKSMRHEHHFVEVKGITHMRDLFIFESPFKPIGLWVDRWILKPYMTRLLSSRNRFLKDRVESQTVVSQGKR